MQDTLHHIRQTLHQNPDLSGDERSTADRISDWLKPTKPDIIHRHIGGNGILAIYGQEDDPLILFRAELDALPIQEENNLTYTSAIPGQAHLCGHDGHMTILMGLAYRWQENPLNGVRLGLLFQPAEETGQGAAFMLADPVIAGLNPFRIFAYHNIPGAPLGQVLIKKGPMTSAVHSTIFRFSGRSSHAAEPQLAHSPNRVIAQLLLAAASMTRQDRTDPDFTVVTPVHTRIGGLAYGTTPGQGEIHFTLRAADDIRLATLQTLLTAYASKLAKEDHLELSHEILEPFPASINHPGSVKQVEIAAQAVGCDLELLKAPYGWGEDMGHFLSAWPGALIGLGSGVDQPPLHHPSFDFPDALIQPGVDLFFHLLMQVQP
ncbi:MAG: amidohydrolase [Saprospiraceae bacterium]|nr:amidohydrolase [Saprospiraceae bacterium]